MSLGKERQGEEEEQDRDEAGGVGGGGCSVCVVESFLGWLDPSSSTAFTLYWEEEDESSTGSNRDGRGERGKGGGLRPRTLWFQILAGCDSHHSA